MFSHESTFHRCDATSVHLSYVSATYTSVVLIKDFAPFLVS